MAVICFSAAVTALVAVLCCYSKFTYMTLALAPQNVPEHNITANIANIVVHVKLMYLYV